MLAVRQKLTFREIQQPDVSGALQLVRQAPVFSLFFKEPLNDQ